MSKRTVGKGLLAIILGWAFNLLGIIIWWCIKMLGLLGWHTGVQLVTHPRTTISAALLSGAVYLVGWEILVGIVGVLVIGAATWKAADRETFDAFLGDFLSAWHRKWFLYRRTWERVMARCGLAVDIDDEREFPQLKKMTRTRYWDRLDVVMAIGQETQQFRDVSEKLRHAFVAERVTVDEIEPASVRVSLMRRDPFRHEVVPAATMPATTADIDFTALPIGLTEQCEPWKVSILGAHTAVTGTTNAGKASVPWNIVLNLAPAIADRTVLLHLADPKQVELRQVRSLAATHVPVNEEFKGRAWELSDGEERESYVTTGADTLAMLRGLVNMMNKAAEAAGERGERDHEPSPETPLHLILIDELAPLLKLWPRHITDNIEDSLGLLLTQGRALGFIVIGAIQEPTKDVFKCRDLFGRRIALRLTSKDQTEASLGDSAIEEGARCHQIPEDLPGVAFQYVQGSKGMTRARAGHVTNKHLADLVEYVQQLRLVAEVAAADRRVTVDVDLNEVSA